MESRELSTESNGVCAGLTRLMNDTPNEPFRDTGLPVPSSDSEDESQFVSEPEVGSLQSEMKVAISTRSGPLPSPQELAEYEMVLPGSAERFMASFKREASQRQRLEWAIEVSAVRRGQWLAFAIYLITLGASVFLIYLDYPVYGLVGVLLAMGTLVSVFLLGKKRQGNSPL